MRRVRMTPTGGVLVEDAGTFPTEQHAGRLDRDDELALAARADPEAFGILYERHRLAVFRYLRTRTRTEDDAAELTAVAFERALAGMPRYRPTGGGVVAWLLRIARNAAIDAGRRRHSVPLDTELADVAGAASPEVGAIERERLVSVAAAVDRLPDVQREALALRYAAGLTAREIGEVLGKTEQATQKLISRALATLREDYRHDR
jgi:RNA polymerase sigma-70 factor, ECF subfamily